MRLPLLLLGAWLLVSAIAHAYPAYEGQVMDRANAFNQGQRNSLLADLKSQAETINVTGIILTLPSQETWDLQTYTERMLAEWQAQSGGVIGERVWVLVLVPSQNRFGLALDEALKNELDPFTYENLGLRLSQQAEENAGVYLATQGVITNLNKAPELLPRKGFLQGGAKWPFALVGMVILIVTLMRAIRKKTAPQ